MCTEEVSGTEWHADKEWSVVEVEGKGVCYMFEKCYDLWEQDMGNERRAATKGGNVNGSVDVWNIIARERKTNNELWKMMEIESVMDVVKRTG